MKKKIFFAIVLIILVISEISIVYADIIIPGQHFNSYNNDKKNYCVLKKNKFTYKRSHSCSNNFYFYIRNGHISF